MYKVALCNFNLGKYCMAKFILDTRSLSRMVQLTFLSILEDITINIVSIFFIYLLRISEQLFHDFSDIACVTKAICI